MVEQTTYIMIQEAEEEDTGVPQSLVRAFPL
jgi:hypothetical protein